jgi:hypothetical protein
MSKLDRFRLMTAGEKDRVHQEIVERCELVADCWIYPVTNSSGYGIKRIGGRLMYTSRFVLAYSTRESLNIKMDACHIGDCPYRACCNPRHLAWGTHAENAAQREQKAREAQWDPRWAKNPVLGYETHVQRTRVREDQTCTVYAPKSGREKLTPLAGTLAEPMQAQCRA